jgi:hypothetical protein
MQSIKKKRVPVLRMTDNYALLTALKFTILFLPGARDHDRDYFKGTGT